MEKDKVRDKDKVTSNVISELNTLLTRNYDAERGYKEAAENVKNPILKDFFIGSASQRYDFGHQIKDEIFKIGGEPDKGTSGSGDLHRAWMNLKEFFTSQNGKAMLEECDRGEKAALDDYNKVLKDDQLPSDARKVILQQRETITQNIIHVENLLNNIK
jgi:uncharacterized protein (TIGR02284 family)